MSATPTAAPSPSDASAGTNTGANAAVAAQDRPSSAADARPGRRRFIALLLVLFAASWFAGLDYRKLAKTDEGRYAEISREMAVSGDWVTPRLNGLKYFEKPPLQYWAGAAAISAFGAGNWQPRLWTAFTGLVAILMLGYTLARVGGTALGWAGAGVLASSLLWVYLGHINALDMSLAATMCLCFCGVVLAEHARQFRGGRAPEDAARSARRWMVFAWAAMALAVLSKGLVGILLPGSALVVTVLLWRDWRLLTRLAWLPGLAVFFAIAAPWFFIVSARNPGFAQFFFIHEHFERFLTPGHRREGAAWYFVPVLVAGLLPWTGMLADASAAAIARRWRGVKADPLVAFIEAPLRFPTRFAAVWAVLIFLFFSVSSSKLPSYILPIFPALALLTARAALALPARRWVWHCVGIAALAVAAILALEVPHWMKPEWRDGTAMAAYKEVWAWSLALLAAGALGAAWAGRRGARLAAVLTLAVAGYLAHTLSLLGYENLADTASGYVIAERLRADEAQARAAAAAGPADSPTAPPAPIYSVGMYEQSFVYYLQRFVTLVRIRDELDFGLREQPERAIGDMEVFVARWLSEPRAYAIMTAGHYDELTGRALPMRVLWRDDDRVLVARH